MTPPEDRAALIAEAERRRYCLHAVTSPCTELSSDPRAYCDHCLIRVLLVALRAAQEAEPPREHACFDVLVSALVTEAISGVRPLLPNALYGQDVALVARFIDMLRAENVQLRAQLAQAQEALLNLEREEEG